MGGGHRYVATVRMDTREVMGGEGVKRIMLLASVGLVALLVMAGQPPYSMLHVDKGVR